MLFNTAHAAPPELPGVLDALLRLGAGVDHGDVLDALLRFGAGVDHGDKALLASAFSEDAVVDFSSCGRRMGLDFPLLSGGRTIVGFLHATSDTQTTTHVITNGRAEIEGSAAKLRALVDATHLPKHDHSRCCRMLNWYSADLVRQEDLWCIRRLTIDNSWFSGDAQVLLNN